MTFLLEGTVFNCSLPENTIPRLSLRSSQTLLSWVQSCP